MYYVHLSIHVSIYILMTDTTPLYNLEVFFSDVAKAVEKCSSSILMQMTWICLKLV